MMQVYSGGGGGRFARCEFTISAYGAPALIKVDATRELSPANLRCYPVISIAVAETCVRVTASEAANVHVAPTMASVWLFRAAA